QVLVEKALEVRALRRKAGERDFFLRMAQMDGLTELFNRQTFLAFMEREFGRARRTGRAISLILAGIDGFGRLCRNEGQLFADNLVRRLGQAFKSNCRDYDIVARFGNEEFALLAPETPRQGAQILVQRLNDAVTRLPACGPEQVSCSFGLAAFPEDGSAPDELLECAARALRPALQPAS
ncbi:MAG: GGDEF domain-containing protein, partial [Deltaproteobacteria bacterium]|nr:GGDEF domain-containing protein [Deltaproteobacteria bacterium]